jgi:two-component system, response regulator
MNKHVTEHSPLWIRFGTVVRQMRIAKKISQEVLAERAQLHRTYLTDVEHGKRNLSIDSIHKIAAALEVSITDLFSQIEHAPMAHADVVLQDAVSTSERHHAVEILVVEDDPSYVELTLHALRMGNVSNKIHVVRDGEEALQYFFPKNEIDAHTAPAIPKLILLDLKLPKVDGIEVLQKIRSHELTSSIPVIVMTSSNDVVDFKQCQELGVQEYIVKPFNFEQFSRIMLLVGFRWLLLDKRTTESLQPELQIV